jgi:hypothetical protein
VFVPIGDDRSQFERIAADVLPLLGTRATASVT